MRLINFIISALIRIIIVLAILFLIFVLYIFLFSAKNDITIEDTVSYLKEFSGETIINSNIENNVTNKTSIDIEPSNIYNIENANTDNRTYFYYEQLDDNSKLIYNALENNIEHLKEENYVIDFSTKFNTLLQKSDGQYKLNKSFQSALDAFLYDHPELFYIDLTRILLTIQSISIGPKTTYTVSIAPKDDKNYLSEEFGSETEVDIAISKVEAIRNNIIKNIENTSDYNKALKVHDMLVNSLEYDSSTNRAHSHNIYGALVEKNVVCEGYAKSFKYILDSLGIECILVSGDATNSSNETEAHMWNYIKLDENWYGVDVTWDDPIIVGGHTSNIIRHTYFGKGNNVFNESHIADSKISDIGQLFYVPKLSNKDYK